MERIQIFKQLLKTEETARIIYDEATEHKEGLAQYLEQAIKDRRDQAFAQAEVEIAQLEKQAVSKTDQAIAFQNEKLEWHLSKVRQRYEQNRDSWVNQIFADTIHLREDPTK